MNSVIIKAVIVYVPTYSNHPKLMKSRVWTTERLKEYADTKRKIKDNFVKAFAGFVGCDSVDVYCRPDYFELCDLFDGPLHEFSRS